MSLHLTSPAFTTETTIPVRHTADGLDLSPPLAWSGLPEAVISWALSMEDPDAPGNCWQHWLLWNVPRARTTMAEGIVGSQHLGSCMRQGRNDFGRIGYGGPAPPWGEEHRYVLRLLALDTRLDLPPGATAPAFDRAVRPHVIDEGVLVGRYRRHGP